jgi:hypothetical protein
VRSGIVHAPEVEEISATTGVPTPNRPTRGDSLNQLLCYETLTK